MAYSCGYFPEKGGHFRFRILSSISARRTRRCSCSRGTSSSSLCSLPPDPSLPPLFQETCVSKPLLIDFLDGYCNIPEKGRGESPKIASLPLSVVAPGAAAKRKRCRRRREGRKSSLLLGVGLSEGERGRLSLVWGIRRGGKYPCHGLNHSTAFHSPFGPNLSLFWAPPPFLS